MHHIYTTDGYILESRSNGETSKVYSIFTRDLGMVWAKAQGVRLQKSKLKPALQSFSRVRISLVRGREMWRITSARAGLNLFREFKSRDGGVKMMARVFLIVRRLLAGEEKNVKLFEIIEAGFDFLLSQEFSETDLRSLEYILVLKILDNLGYRARGASLQTFIASPFSLDTAASFRPHQRGAALEINAALRESHL